MGDAVEPLSGRRNSYLELLRELDDQLIDATPGVMSIDVVRVRNALDGAIQDIAALYQANERLRKGLEDALTFVDAVCDSFPDGDPPHPTIQECLEAGHKLTNALKESSNDRT